MSFQIIRRKEQAKGVAARWKAQYFHDGKWGNVFRGSSEDIYRRLVAAKGNAEKIDKIVTGWASTWCGECKEYKPLVAEIGNDYTVTVCDECLRKILNLMV
jgi:thiol-disulfide isomerase/thioredoxin